MFVCTATVSHDDFAYDGVLYMTIFAYVSLAFLSCIPRLIIANLLSSVQFVSFAVNHFPFFSLDDPTPDTMQAPAGSEFSPDKYHLFLSSISFSFAAAPVSVSLVCL